MKHLINDHIKSYASKLKDGQKLSLSSVQAYLRGLKPFPIKISLKALKRRCNNIDIKL